MKQNYLFFRSADSISPETLFLKVRVGKSQRDQLALSSLRRICEANGHYLQLWSNDVADAFWQICCNLFPGCALPTAKAKCDKITPQKLLEILHDGSFDLYEKHWCFSSDAIRLMSILGIIPPQLTLRKKEKKNSASRSTYNLSHGVDSERSSAYVGFLLILVIFLLGAHLEYLFF